MKSKSSHNKSRKSRWMAVYTQPRSEKKVNERLEETGIETYLPLRKTKRQWSDRVKLVELPLIPSYVFVRCRESERREILQTDGVLNFVFYRGRPAIIRDEEMERMWSFLAEYDRLDMDLEVVHLEPGQKVKVDAGPLEGKKGEVVHVKDNRVSIVLESLGMQIRAELEGAMVQRLQDD